MAIRFPLILLVLFIHALPFAVVPLPEAFSVNYLYIYSSELISHYFSSSVVPTFFLISGYYFFYRKTEWSLNLYLRSLKSRVKTLLIPYILFNLILLALMLLKEYAMAYFHINGQLTPNLSVFEQNSLLDLMLMPIDFPLWYIRDLIVVCVFSPLFYLAHRYLGGLVSSLICLGLYFASLYVIPLNRLPLTGITFFGLGAFLSLSGKNILALIKPYRVYIVGIFLALVIINGFLRSYALSLVHIILGVFALISMMSYLIVWAPRIKEICIKLATATFFVYATHLIFIESWVKGAFSRSILYANGWGKLLAYFLTPLITLAVCLALFYLMKKFVPKVLAVLCGGRI